MPSIGKTLVFPRKDNIYKHKESLGYDEIQTLVWKNRPKLRAREHLSEWLVYIVIGISVGCIAFIMVIIEEFFSEKITDTLNDMIQESVNTDNNDVNDKYIKPWLFYAFSCGFCGLFASALTTYWGPAAAGSGVAEFIGYINGVNYPNFISIPSLVTKIFGVTFAVIGKLAIGKEGPLAHIGSIIGIGVLYLPGFNRFEHLRNDENRRVFSAAGASAGVSVAFGAPIGGTLFSYELSRPNTFWRFSMIWKVFMACSLGSFTLALLLNIVRGNLNGDWSGSSLKFGNQ